MCVFYNELRDWRSTAVQCGLQVPNMEPSNQGTADQQWSEARAYWNTLRSLWAIQAQNRDVIDPALSQPTPGEFAKSVKLNTHTRQVISVPAMWLQKYSHVYRLPTTLVGRCLIILELA